MLFSSITYLFVFMPVVLLVYFVVPVKWRNAVLLVSSLVFYFSGEPVYTVLLLFSSISDYLHSLYIEKHRNTNKAKGALISSIVINLGMLFFFKYTDFFITTINSLCHTAIPLLGLSLPIGISFFTFQTMSYTIDVYRGKVHAQKNLLTLATFVCLFPQLIAGPIVRYADIEVELAQRQSKLEDIAAGVSRFVYGLGKKVLIANAMGELCAVFTSSLDKSVLFYWVYAIAFTLQIYFDFSGYSDMAIGLGKIFGFTFPENFDYPYMSKSITEFWRRWHMTLGGWFRDYVYIPLGGNRVSKGKWLRNIAIVWLLTGLWHGAAWNFVIWGAMFGVLLIIEKLWLKPALDKGAHIWPHIYVMFLVIVSFVIFNANGLGGMVEDLKGLFGFAGLPASSLETVYYLRSYAILLVVAIIGATSWPKKAIAALNKTSWGAKLITILQPVAIAVLMLLVTAALVDGSFNPFLYFRF